MGKSKELFMQMQEEFLDVIDNYDNGEISALDCAVKFKKDNDLFEQLINERKAFLDENKEEIESESSQYGKEGYKGFIFSVMQRKSLDFSKYPEIANLKNKIKEIESKGKLALQLIEKGVEPVDANTGEILPVPEVKITSFIKVDKAK